MALVTVAVGILIDDAGRVLVTRRAPEAHQGGLWEFPGGKVEDSENILAALARELREELGVLVEATEALMELEHDYGDQRVRLDVHRVTRWSGEPRGLEGQAAGVAATRATKGLGVSGGQQANFGAIARRLVRRRTRQ